MSVANYPRELYMSPTYNSWRGMKDRCDSPSHVAYDRYGGKGVSYCDSWKEFKAFYEDMGIRPEGMTLDRINNSLGYSKDNCRWATLSRQARNKNFKSKTGHKFICPLGKRFHVQVRPFKGLYARSLEEALKLRSELFDLLQHVKFKGDTMLPDTISFTKRKNEGNYNHSELTVTATLEDGENLQEAIKSLKNIVLKALDLGTEQVGTTGTVAADPSRVEHKEDKLTGAKAEIRHGGVKSEVGGTVPDVITKEKATRGGKKDKAEVATKADSPSANGGGTSTVVGTVDTKNVTTVQSTPPKTETPVIDKTVVTYDTKIVEHRSRFAKYLGDTYPNWKPDTQFGPTPAGQEPTPEKKAYMDSVKSFSLGLHGKAFEDTKGNMLESFKIELANFFGTK